MVCQRATGRQRTSHCCWTRLGRHQGRPPKKTQARHHLLFLRGSCCSKRPGLVGWRRRAASELCSGLGDSHNGQNERTTLKKMTCMIAPSDFDLLVGEVSNSSSGMVQESTSVLGGRNLEAERSPMRDAMDRSLCLFLGSPMIG